MTVKQAFFMENVFLLPFKLRQIHFRGEVENLSANQKLGGDLGFPVGQKNTNLVEDVAFLLPLKFCQLPFSRFRGKCLSQSEDRVAILVS